jgi:hypothetical protein
MGDEIGFGSSREPGTGSAPMRQLIPMQVGHATVYVEQISQSLEIQTDDTIRPVAPSPGEAFGKASEILQECVRVLGERVEGLTERAKPAQVTVEFTLSFEVAGRAQLIPVLLTGESKAATGLKVTAVWETETVRS